MLGDINAEKTKVCSFTTAHFDEKDKPLWYSGSLLKNKLKNITAFDEPTRYMNGGVWEMGAVKPDISCMRDTTIVETSEEERNFLRKSVERAKDVELQIEQFATLNLLKENDVASSTNQGQRICSLTQKWLGPWQVLA